MGNQVSGRPLDPGVTGRTLTDHGRAIAQLQRLMAKRPKAEPAPSGLIAGQAEVFATNGTVKAFSGEIAMEFGTVAYDAPYDPQGGDTPDWITVDGCDIYLEPGWYGAVMFVKLGWAVEANAPTSYAVYMGGGYDMAHVDTTVLPRAHTQNGRYGIYQYLNLGHVYAQGIDQGSDYSFRCEVQFPEQTAGANSADGNIGWTFTKYA